MGQVNDMYLTFAVIVTIALIYGIYLNNRGKKHIKKEIIKCKQLQ